MSGDERAAAPSVQTSDVCKGLWKRPIRGQGSRGQPQKVALEMEMLAFDSQSLSPLGLEGARISSQTLLKRVAATDRKAILKEDSSTGVIIGVQLATGGNFSLEPGGQVEYSSAPLPHFSELIADVAQGLERLEEASAGEVLFASHGTNPLGTVDMPLLLPKARYQILSRYFASQVNGRGLHMSRHTCTVQPNLDVYGDEAWADAVTLSYVLTPFVRHLFSNSRYFQGKVSLFPSERQEIWLHTDPSRSGIPPTVPFAPDIACAYLEWAMQAYVMLIENLPIEEQPKHGELRFGHWLQSGYKGTHPSLHDWETHLGTLFPELRLRGYLEVRCVDAQPFEHTLAPVAFWSGLLQSSSARARTWEFMLGIARTHLNCALQSGESDKAGKLGFQSLLTEDQNHPLFRDAEIHSQLLSIAQDALMQRNEPEGCSTLAAYRAFIPQKTNYWDAADAAAFVRKIGTLTPSKSFLANCQSQSLKALSKD